MADASPVIPPCPARRLFALIPAAGRSRRMGRPKLLLPLGGQTVIARLMHTLDVGAITDRLVVVRRDDAPLIQAVEQCGATAVKPEVDPPDMRASIEHGLAAITARHQPHPDDGWLLIPADHPVLLPEILEHLVQQWQSTSAALMVPVFAGRKGHPLFCRWRLVEEIRQIPPDQGLNQLVRNHSADLLKLPVDDDSVLIDLDTPADYERVRQRLSGD